MTSQIAVSVILPSLNVGRYIKKCLDSVLNQKLKEIEILCIDAGSTDGTLDYIQNCAEQDDRVILMRSEKRSYGYQVNLGFQQARGRYIAIVDTDDFIEPEMYQTLYETAVKTGFPDFVKCGSYEFGEMNDRLYRWDSNSCTGKVSERIEGGGNRQIFFDSFANIWDKIYRTDFIKENQITLNESKGAAHQDTGLKYQVASLAESMSFAEGSFYNYRIDNPNASMKRDDLWDAIYQELRFVENRLADQLNEDQDLSDRIRVLKIELYKWSYDRISMEYRARLSDLIREELQQLCMDSVFYNGLSTELKEQISTLMAKEHRETEEDRRKATAKACVKGLIQAKENEYILVSCGTYGERVLFLQEVLNHTFIRRICDNNNEKQGMEFHGYRILSVEDAVKASGNRLKYCIANKDHYETMKVQLIGLGVNQDRIMQQFEMPGKAELFWMAKSN